MKLFGLSLLAGAMLVATAQAETLKFAHFVPPGHTVTPAVVDPLVQGAKENSGGALEIQVFPGGELGPGPVEQYTRALSGVADIVWGLPGYTSSQFPLSMIVELPGVVDAKGDGYKRIWAAIDDLGGEFPGTKPLALWTSEPNVLVMKDKQVRSPADLAGLKIRVSGAVAGRVIEALGATPVQMPANEMYNALQTGLIDGIMTGSSAIGDFKLSEVATSYTYGASLGNILFYVVVNQAKYDALPEAERAALDASSTIELSAHAEAGWNAKADEVVAMLRADATKTVIDLSADEIAAFNALTVGVRDTVVAELEAQGLPAKAVLAKMTGM